MSTLLIRHAERSTMRKVTCDCKKPDDCDNEICRTHTIKYVLGKCPPNYPMPSIYCHSLVSRVTSPMSDGVNILGMLLQAMEDRA